MELWINELWLFITAVVFTFVGKYITMRSTVEEISETVLDKLIEDGYIKTKGSGKNMEILKYWENND
jgi:hypothetical protein